MCALTDVVSVVVDMYCVLVLYVFCVLSMMTVMMVFMICDLQYVVMCVHDVVVVVLLMFCFWLFGCYVGWHVWIVCVFCV